MKLHNLVQVALFDSQEIRDVPKNPEIQTGNAVKDHSVCRYQTITAGLVIVLIGAGAEHFGLQLGAETVIFGPGDIDLAHQPDEYLDMGFVTPTERAIVALVTKFCTD